VRARNMSSWTALFWTQLLSSGYRNNSLLMKDVLKFSVISRTLGVAFLDFLWESINSKCTDGGLRCAREALQLSMI
jgi:hypothetical protein